jgi:cytidylate kinase
MTRSVICISRALGASGEEIGQAVARAMGYRYVDDEIIVRAAEKAGITPDEMAKAERPPGLIARLLESLGKTSADPSGWASYAAFTAEQAPTAEGIIELAVKETARAGNAVIVAHGASISLGRTPGVLRILVTGSQDVRADRLRAVQGLSEGEAQKAIDSSDRARRDYIDRFYKTSEQPTDYDLVLNTDTISAETAAQLISAAAQA